MAKKRARTVQQDVVQDTVQDGESQEPVKKKRARLTPEELAASKKAGFEKTKRRRGENTTRAVLFKVYPAAVKTDEEFEETWKHWHDIALQVRKANNWCWLRFAQYHLERGHDDKIAEWLDIPKAERASLDELGIKPEDPGLYKACARKFPKVHTNVISSLTNVFNSKLKAKTKNSKLNLWLAVLVGNVGTPSIETNPPIPVPKVLMEFLVPEDPMTGKWVVELRLGRQLDSPKTNKPSVVTLAQIDLPHGRDETADGRKAKAQRQMLAAIAGGQQFVCDSQLLYKRKKKAWFLSLVISRPKDTRIQYDKDSTATVRCGSGERGETCPLIMTFPDGSSIQIGNSYKQHIAANRRKSFAARKAIQHSYKVAKAARGHGQERATQPWRTYGPAQSWNTTTRMVNHKLSKDVVRICMDRKIGKVVFVRPKTNEGYLAEIGNVLDSKTEKPDSQSGWPWFELGEFIKYKADAVNIKPKVTDSSKEDETDGEDADACPDLVDGGAPIEETASSVARKVAPPRNPRGRSNKKGT